MRGPTNRLLPNDQGVRLHPPYGQPVILSCKGGPGFLAWYIGDTLVPTGTLEGLRWDIYQELNSSSSEQYLHITNFMRSYRGIYTCATARDKRVAKHVLIENGKTNMKCIFIYTFFFYNHQIFINVFISTS